MTTWWACSRRRVRVAARRHGVPRRIHVAPSHHPLPPSLMPSVRYPTAGTAVPCVGVSIGVERVFAIMEARAKAAEGGLKRTPVAVLVAAIPSARYNMTVERMRLAARLWRAGIATEFVYAVDPKLQRQVTTAAEGNIPFTIVLGEDELDAGMVQLKDMAGHAHTNVPLAEVDAILKRKLAGGVASGDGGAPAPASVTGASGDAAAGAGAGVAASMVGVVVEGSDRGYGKFSRPAVPIAVSGGGGSGGGEAGK